MANLGGHRLAHCVTRAWVDFFRYVVDFNVRRRLVECDVFEGDQLADNGLEAVVNDTVCGLAGRVGEELLEHEYTEDVHFTRYLNVMLGAADGRLVG